ncbi:MAG: C10 family peptidase [Marinilabiliales bacterium]|nr:C10 family peptidase [Marinilabiliales bacterium]
MKKLSFFWIGTMLMVLSCSKENPSAEKLMLSFGFSRADNPAMSADVSATISGSSVSAFIPGDVNLATLKANFTASEKAVVKIGSTIQTSHQTVNDFTQSTAYIVTAEDGSSSTYNVTVKTTELPKVNTLAAYDILLTRSVCGGDIVDNGGADVTDKGICWGTTANPTISGQKITGGSGAGSFAIMLTDLLPGTTYHIRAYATNLKGTSYGADLNFSTYSLNALPPSVTPLMHSKWSVFTWPYNAYYPAYAGSSQVHSKYPAPCGPTTLARVLAFWGGRISGIGKIDAMNSTNEVRFNCDLSALSIDYNNLPETLGETSSEAQYRNVANIFLEAGAVGLTNAIDAGTPDDYYINALKKYFNISSEVRFAKRWEYSREDWIKLLKTELAYGRPLMIAARTVNSPAPGQGGKVEGHWFNIEGYNAENQFYIDYNYQGTGFRGYFDVDDFGVYKSYGLVVVGFHPK